MRRRRIRLRSSAVRGRQLHAVVDAGERRRVGVHGDHGQLGDQPRDDVGEVLLALGVVGGQLVQRGAQGLGREGVDDGVDLARRVRCSGVASRSSTIAGDRSGRVAQDPAVAVRVGGRASWPVRRRRSAVRRGARRAASGVSTGASPGTTSTASASSSTPAANAVATAWPVPRCSCLHDHAPGLAARPAAASAATSSAWCPTTTTTRSAPSGRTASSTHRSSERPATSWRTLARSDRRRTPRPAARTTTASITGGGSPSRICAGGEGIEPSTSTPKDDVMPFHHPPRGPGGRVCGSRRSWARPPGTAPPRRGRTRDRPRSAISAACAASWHTATTRRAAARQHGAQRTGVQQRLLGAGQLGAQRQGRGLEVVVQRRAQRLGVLGAQGGQHRVGLDLAGGCSPRPRPGRRRPSRARRRRCRPPSGTTRGTAPGRSRCRVPSPARFRRRRRRARRCRGRRPASRSSSRERLQSHSAFSPTSAAAASAEPPAMPPATGIALQQAEMRDRHRCGQSSRRCLEVDDPRRPAQRVGGLHARFDPSSGHACARRPPAAARMRRRAAGWWPWPGGPRVAGPAGRAGRRSAGPWSARG